MDGINGVLQDGGEVLGHMVSRKYPLNDPLLDKANREYRGSLRDAYANSEELANLMTEFIDELTLPDKKYVYHLHFKAAEEIFPNILIPESFHDLDLTTDQYDEWVEEEIPFPTNLTI